MMFEKNDLVELENGSRLYVSSTDCDGIVHLSLTKNGSIIARIPITELSQVETSKFVLLMLDDGKFTDSWENDTPSTEPKNVIDDDAIKLIEFRCHNDANFEFSHLMKLR